MRSPAVHAADLARRMTRASPYPEAAAAAIEATAEGVLRLGRSVPADVCLILGGSLARGEANFVLADERTYVLESDLDFLLVHESALPPMSCRGFVGLARDAARLPTATVMTASAREYARLGTALGYDFKNLGIPVNRSDLPHCAPVSLDARDAYEVFLYGIQLYFFAGILDRWAEGDTGREFDLELNRICVKLLRACGMLSGAHCHSDLAAMEPSVRAAMNLELAWRRGQCRKPLAPGRFWSHVRLGLALFDACFGEPRGDAVTGSKFEGCPGAAFVARNHRIAHDLSRAIAAGCGVAAGCGGAAGCADDVLEARAVVDARQKAWSDLVEAGTVRPHYCPEEYFGACADAIRDSLYSMKVSPPCAVGAAQTTGW